jgi:TPP-dependent pyruvate/acetoin dehydrogenase alpha subunit
MNKLSRSENYNLLKNIEKKIPKKTILNIFKKMSMIKFFEEEIRDAHKNKLTTPLVYLSLGQESVSASISEVFKKPFVLAQHRGHGPYLSFGGDPIKLVDELLGLKSGCCEGKGGSPMIHDFKKKIIGHCGLVGDQVPVAVGISLAKKNDFIVCFFGDGAAEEDYVLAALGYAATRKLKILFICDDNNLSVLTPINDRRTWQISNVAKSFGMNAVDIADDPWNIYYWGKKFKKNLPALINIRTCRDTWHVGSGRDKNLEWNRFEITKNKLKKFFSKSLINKIERKEKNWAKKTVQKQLLRLSVN